MDDNENVLEKLFSIDLKFSQHLSLSICLQSDSVTTAERTGMDSGRHFYGLLRNDYAKAKSLAVSVTFGKGRHDVIHPCRLCVLATCSSLDPLSSSAGQMGQPRHS